MAKIAVIFVLFALCSVAMSARITREEPDIFQRFANSIKALGDAGNNFINSPAIQEQWANIQKQSEEIIKKGGDDLKVKAAELQANIQEFAKKTEGPAKDLAEAAKKAIGDLAETKK